MAIRIGDIKKRFEDLKGREGEFVAKSLEEEKGFLVNLNQEQLYDGKTSEGKDIYPTYLDDPYFKTLGQALAYSAWKDRISPNPRRGKHIPNLFINGYFYHSIEVKVDKAGVTYNSNFGEESSIEETFGTNIYGLNDKSKATLNKTLKPATISKIREDLRL